MHNKKCRIEIIDHPSLKTWLREITEWTFTTLFWGIWIYLALPLLNLLVWIVSGKIFYQEVIKDMGYKYIGTLIKEAGLIVVTTTISFLAWGYYNYIWFGKRNRRKFTPKTTIHEIALAFDIDPKEIDLFHKGKFCIFWIKEKEQHKFKIEKYQIESDASNYKKQREK